MAETLERVENLVCREGNPDREGYYMNMIYL
jgi:hypothetical protein